MPFVSITRLRVRSFRYLPVFLIGAFRSARQAKNAPGNLAVSLLSDSNFTFWTRTLWNDERSMRAFLLAGSHRRVMPRLLQWCRGYSLAARLVRTAIMAGGTPPSATGGASLQSRLP